MTLDISDTNSEAQPYNDGDSSILKLIKKWKASEAEPNFDDLKALKEMCVTIEEEYNFFLSHDPDPFDERLPRKIPIAGDYGRICNDLINSGEFLMDIITRYINISSSMLEIEKLKAALRLFCTLLTCISLKEIFTEYDDDSRDQFANRMFELSKEENYPLNLYSTFILGFLTKEDDALLSQHRDDYLNLLKLVSNRLITINSHITKESESRFSAIDDNSNSSMNFVQNTSSLWNLCDENDGIKDNIKIRMMLFFLRQIAETTFAVDTLQEKNILYYIANWLKGHNYNDFRLTFETLRFLMKLMCHRNFYMEFYDKYDGINLLLNIPRPSIAAGGITYCLFNLITHQEIIDKFITLSTQIQDNVMQICLWTIEKSHPSSRCYAMLCIQHLIRHNHLLNTFENLSGPRHLLNCFVTMQNLLNVGESRNAKKDGIYYALLRTTFNTLKVSLEQSLLVWSKDIIDTIWDIPESMLFPSIEYPFSSSVMAILPAAMYYQTWQHPYLSDNCNIIKVIYSQSNNSNDDEHDEPNFFQDAFHNSTEVVHSSLDILSLLCLSNKFVAKLFDYNESNTKPALKSIFSLLSKKPSSYSYSNLKAVKSILFFLSILCCRPLQGPTQNRLFNNNNNNNPVIRRKRKYEEVEQSESSRSEGTDDDYYHNQESSVRLIGDSTIEALEFKVRSPQAVQLENTIQTTTPTTALTTTTYPSQQHFISPHSPIISFQEVQSKLWRIIRGFNIIRKLLSLIEAPLSPLDVLTIRTLICHILTGVSRSSDIKAMLQKLPTMKKNIQDEKIFETPTRERCTDFLEFRRFAKKLNAILFGNCTGDLSDRDMRPEHVKRAEIVDRTKIQWDKSELISIIHKYLLAEGYHETADNLRKEAELIISNPAYDFSINSPLPTSIQSPEHISLEPLAAATSTPKRAITSQTNNSASLISITTPTTKLQPILPPISKSKSASFTEPLPITDSAPKTQHRFTFNYPQIKSADSMTTNLDDLVESYLRNQHAQCINPTSICPKFSLHKRHQCPTLDETCPRGNNVYNYIYNRARFDTSRYTPNYRFLRNYVHQSFRPKITLYESDVFEHERLFTDHFCFSNDQEDGLYFASMDQTIVYTHIEMTQQPLKIGDTDYPTSNLENTKDGRTLVVSSFYSRRPTNGANISLFDVSRRNEYESKVERLKEYHYSGYSELSKRDDSKLVVTQGKSALIVDMEIGALMYTCPLTTAPPKNRPTFATFSYDDSMIFHYGTLWDIRVNNARGAVATTNMHEFDNLEDIVSGVFHPNGHEIIIGSSIWDLRKFRLQRNIPSLKNCKIKFNGHGDFFYTYKDSLYQYPNNPIMSGHNLFSCYDSRDYNIVATVDTNRVIQSLAVDPKDMGVAVLETSEDGAALAQCRIYCVGHKSEFGKGSDDNLDDVEEELGGGDDDDDDDDDIETDDDDEDDDDDDGFFIHDDDDDEDEDEQRDGRSTRRGRRFILNIGSNHGSVASNAEVELLMDLGDMLDLGNDNNNEDENNDDDDDDDDDDDEEDSSIFNELIESVDGDGDDEDDDEEDDDSYNLSTETESDQSLSSE